MELFRILSSYSVMLGFDPKASHILGRHSIAELYHNLFYFETGFHEVLQDHKFKASLTLCTSQCTQIWIYLWMYTEYTELKPFLLSVSESPSLLICQASHECP